MVASFFPKQKLSTIDSLDAFGYDEAAQYVYGCTYPDWKKRHQKKVNDEQMGRFNGSKHLHAKHDKELLAIRSAKGSKSHAQSTPSAHGEKAQEVCIKRSTQQSSLLSDVCCQDVEGLVVPSSEAVQMYTSNQIPIPKGNLGLKIGVLTVSDRAASNAYETGDLSGPAVEGAVVAQIDHINSSLKDLNITVSHLVKRIVADELLDIKEVLLLWSGKTTNEDDPYDLVFTTGGTGFAQRDVTPEATLSILDRECQGLMTWASVELTAKQPLATLSRAAAGTCGSTLIVNLPGNPSGAAQVVHVLFPLLLHAVKDLRSSD